MSTAHVMSEHGVEFAWGAASDVGKVRKVNEDSYLVCQGAFVVADGMGGHQAGDVASRLTVGSVRDTLGGSLVDISDLDRVVQHAHDTVRRHSSESGREGMGSTMVGLFVVRNGDDVSLVVVNVGDSRCYVILDGDLRQVTKDHSHVQELIDAGEITEADARHHPERNVVTQAIGVESSVAADFVVLPHISRSRILLCSDGVSGELTGPQLHDILRSTSDPQQAADTLIEAVLSGRAADNATAIVVDVVRQRMRFDTRGNDDPEATGPPPVRDLAGLASLEEDRSPIHDIAVIADVPLMTRESGITIVPTVIDDVPG